MQDININDKSDLGNQVGLKTRNKIEAWKLTFLGVLMFAFGFALTPLYDLFCDITGLNGKVEQSTVALSAQETEMLLNTDTQVRTVVVRFPIHNVTASAKIRALTEEGSVPVGEPTTAYFEIKNMTNAPLTVRAIPSLVPGLAAEHFRKLACFCFGEIELQPLEVRVSEMRYVISPALDEAYDNLAMGYNLYNVQTPANQENSKENKES